MRAAIYARYSSDLQSERSIDDQVALCRDHAARLALGDVVDVYADAALSGAHAASRPQLQRLLADARAGRFDVVVAEALDRLSRDQEDTAAIHKRLAFAGARIVTVSEGEISELHVGLKGTMNALFLQDLGRKIRRGQTGRVKAGFCPGGRAYGYKIVRELGPDGELVKGRRAVDPAEAAVVTRIFEAYADGRSARAIAGELNREKIPAPRGGKWTVSTINGNRARRNGILWNEGYTGKIVYNRARFVRDPETGKRLPRRNGRDDWVSVDVPELRIVGDDLWQRVQLRKARLAAYPAHVQRRPKRLLSGLVVCGCCGATMTIVRPGRLGCSARRNGGACDNGAGVAPDRLEARVLAGLKDRLLAPGLIEDFVRRVNDGLKQRRRAEAQAAAAGTRELADVERKIARIVEAIEDGTAVPALRDRLRELEARRLALEVARAQDAEDNVVDLHPNLAGAYRAKIADLERKLAGDDASRQRAAVVLRSLIERVIVTPARRRGENTVELVGRLTGLLALATGRPTPDPASMIMVVAEEGFEPPTQGL